MKYLNSFFLIITTYGNHFFIILLYEFFFIIKYGKIYNKYKLLNSTTYSDAIPCSFYILSKIEKFLKKRNINNICDLGSGYGKVVFFIGYILKKKIDGYELNKEIYNFSGKLNSNKVNLYNRDFLKINFKKKKYDCFIINDPLKKNNQFIKMIKKINYISKKKKYFIFININFKKIKIVKKYLNPIINIEYSDKKNLLIYSDK